MSASTLHTDRFDLSCPCASDAGAYHAFYAETDLKVGKYRAGLSPSEVDAVLTEDIAQWGNNGFGMFLIRPKAEATVVGGVGIRQADNWPSHELTWWVMPKNRRQGIAKEASKTVLNWAFTTLGWSKVETHFRDANTAARQLTEKLGGIFDRRETFPDGVARDVYAFTKSGLSA